jgi:Alginate lyase.
MTVDISSLRIATPLPVSDTNPVALELPGPEALVRCPEVIRQLLDGGLWLSAPTKGASSKSTKRTRCEWKEDDYWYMTSAAKHWSRQEMVVNKVNSALKVVIGQIHVKDATTPPLKVFWNKGKITLGFRTSFDNPEIVNSVLHPNVPLGTRFKLSIGVTHTGYISVNVLVPGTETISKSLWMDTSWRDQLLQFHGGVYNQVDYTENTLPYDGSECIISELTITH